MRSSKTAKTLPSIMPRIPPPSPVKTLNVWRDSESRVEAFDNPSNESSELLVATIFLFMLDSLGLLFLQLGKQ